MPGLSEKNYQDRVVFLKDAIRRFEKQPGWEGAVAGYQEAIGNVYREFDVPQSREWYEKSVELLRRAFPDPSTRVAFVLWKMGDPEAFQKEIEAVLLFEKTRLEDAKWVESAVDREKSRAEVEMLTAYFLSGDYESTLRMSEEMLAARGEANRCDLIQAILQMAKGMLTRNRQDFDSGIAVLESKVEEWPTSNSNAYIDLYRYSQHLRGVSEMF